MRYVVYLTLLTLGASLFVSHYWLKFRLLNRRFNYRITDIWAAMVGLVPTMLAAGNLHELGEAFRISNALIYVIGMAFFQVAGLAAGRMDLEIREQEPGIGPITAWSSAVSIVAGALLGLVAASFILPVIVALTLG